MKKLLIHLSLLLMAFILIGCDKENGPTESKLPPAIPTLYSPANNASDVTIPMTFSWCTSSDASSYGLQVSTDSLFVNMAYDTSGIAPTVKQVRELNYSTIYYWRVNATNKNGTSGWSPVSHFTTCSLPSTPILSSPADNETKIVVSPILIWNPSNGAATYTLQVSTDNAFTSFVYNEDSITSTSQQITGLLFSSL